MLCHRPVECGPSGSIAFCLGRGLGLLLRPPAQADVIDHKFSVLLPSWQHGHSAHSEDIVASR